MPLPIFKRALQDSDPRKPTTSRPKYLIKDSPNVRHEKLYPRKADRGSSAPVMGVRQLMSNGSAGAVPVYIKPLYNLISKQPIIGGSQQKALAVVEKLQKSALKKDLSSKVMSAVYSRNTISALQIAQSPRLAPNRPSLMRGVIRDQIGGDKFGHVFARHLVTPKPIVTGIALARIVRTGVQPVNERDTETVGSELSVMPSTMPSPDISSADIAKNIYGSNMTIEKGEVVPTATDPAKERERLLFLGAVAVLGFIMLRKM